MSKATKGIFAETVTPGSAEYFTGSQSSQLLAGEGLATMSLAGPVLLYDGEGALVGDYPSIQAAIDAASDGYTVEVSAGTYNETFNVNRDLTIVGLGEVDIVGNFRADNGVPSGTTVGDWLETHGGYSGASGATITADGVTLENLNFSQFVRAIDLGATSANLSLNDIDIDDSVYGIAKLNNGNADGFAMTGGSIRNGYIGIAVDSTGQAGGSFDGISIAGVTFEHLTEKGIYADHISHASITDIVMTDVGEWGRGPAFGSAAQVGEFGAGIDLNLKYGAYAGITIDGFTFTDVGSSSGPDSVPADFGAAIVVRAREDSPSYSANPATLDGVVIRNGTIDGTSTGIRLGEPTKTMDSTTNLVVSNVSVTNYDVAIVDNVDTQPLTWSGSAGPDDFVAAATATGPIIVNGLAGDDTITGGGGDDELNGGADNDTLDGGAGNDILDSGTGNDVITGGAGTDTARVGHWLEVSDFIPNGSGGWTVNTLEGTVTVSGIEILQTPTGRILLVGSGGFSTIQAAVDAAQDYDIIVVAPGTYVEQVVIDDIDGLAIRGAAGGPVTIQAPADLHETARSISGREIHAVFTVKNSELVGLRDIDIDGAGAGNSVDESDGPGQANFYGVFYRNSAGSLENVNVAHVRDALVDGELSGVQRGVGVGVDNEVQKPFFMFNGSISDFQKNATVLNGALLAFNGVTITGGGATESIAQNGIQVTNSSGDITGNTITGIGYAGPADAYSGGVLAFGNTNLNIQDNVVTGANIDDTAAKIVGIWVFQSGAPSSGGSISGNIISYVDEGIDVTGDIMPNGILIENNDVSEIDSTNGDPLGVYFEPDPVLTTPYDVDGTAGDDVLGGGAGNDNLSGLGGNDRLSGSGGNDSLSGGGDRDIAAYGGARSGYSIGTTTDSAGRVTGFSSVTDTDSTNGNDGADMLSGIETLSFAGVTLDLADPVQLFDAGGRLVGTFTTIQAAIDAASDDYTIRVAAGTYDEDLLVSRGVSILGAGVDGAVAGRDSAGGAGETTILGRAQVTAIDNVTLNGLRFLNDASTTAPTLQILTGGGATGHLVTHSIFWSTIAGGAGGVDDRAISTVVIPSGLITITDNLISGASQGQFGTASWGRGLWFDGGGVDLIFTGNVVEWTRSGLNLDMSGDSTADVSNNVFRGLGTGMALGVDAVGLTVAGNTAERVGTEFSFRNLATGATFDAGTAIGALTAVGDSNDLVVVLGGSGNDNLTGTSGADVIDGNNSPTAPNAADSDVLSGGGGNDQLFGRGGDDLLDGGTGDDAMIGGAGNDIYVVDSAGDTVTETGGTDEIRTGLSSYTLAADLENLTGTGSADQSLAGNGGDNTITGGGGNDSIEGGGGVDTARYTGPATIVENGGGGWTVADAGGGDTLSNVEQVDDGAAGKTLLVGNGGYGTIQEAIDAASDGDTILVASGTYAENLDVDKDVTIRGPNHGVAGTGTRAAEAAIDGRIVINAAGATLDGVRIVGAAPGSLYTTAVEVKANDFTLVNSVLDGTSDIAIFVGLVTGLDVGRNLIQGSSIGLYVAGGNTAGSIHDNRFQGDGGPATGLGNGINSESSHVLIANNIFDGLYAGSLNLFPFGPDSVDLDSYVVGNTITNSGAARPVQIIPTALTHNILGTGFNEAFDGETAALGGVAGPFSFDGRGGDDHAWGGESGDTFSGGAGNDQLFGNGGSDNLSGGDNNDIVSGGAGADTASGGNGNDVLNGGGDDDSLSGGAGVDTLNGELGNDTLHGGSGNDNLHGGAGTDRAVYDGHRGDYSITMITGAGGRIVGFGAVSDNEPSNGNEGADSLISVEVLQFSNRTLDATLPVQLFDQNNQLIGTFGTIQAAIDGAQDNYTIRVAAGLYDEDLLIDVGVRILGARVSAVTGRDAASGVGETTIVGHAKVTAEDNVTLTGLRFLNDSTTTGGGASNPTLQILTGGGTSGHLVSNSIFWSAVAGGANGVDDRAISAPSISDGQLTLTGNLVSGASQGLFATASWGRGLWMDGGGIALSASGNIVEWTRSGLVLDGAGGSVYFVNNNNLRNLGTAFSIATSEDGLISSGNQLTNVGDEYNFRNLSESVTFDAGATGDTLTPVGTSNDFVVILGGSGNDVLTGTANADYIDANNRPNNLTVADTDVLNGAGGNDILLGRFGTDTLNGGTGDDNLDGGAGDDIVNGEADNDILGGGAGNDRLTGGSGDDTIDGGTGTDTAVVGTGATYAAGGTGWQVSSASTGTDTLTNVEIVDSGPGPNVLLVGSGGFATIQEAVDAAQDGDTILVAGGIYVEQVIVANVDNLTIMAADGASVTIKAPADLVETARSSSDREIHAVLTAKDSLNLTLQNIDIDGDGRGNTVDEGGGAGTANFYGIYYRNSSGNLFDVDIRGVRDPYPGGTAAGGQPLVDGVQRGIALVVDNDSLLGFTMIGGSISDFQKNATVFNRADLNVAGVVITGGGAQTIIAQNGIQVANSTGSISANTISGIGYAGPADAYSGAILSSGNTNLTIAGNAITGANIDNPAAKAVGIWVYQTGAPNSGGMIVGNSISHVDYGISVDGDITPNGIQIENNSIANLDGTDTDPLGVYFGPNPALVTAHDVDGSEANDSLAGGAGNDSLSGLDGNDTLTGNGGDDTLNGDGGGDDVAVYGGPRSGYAVAGTTDAAGRMTAFATVDDVDAGNGDEGTDTLTGVERLQFGDLTLDLADPVQLFDGEGQLVGTFETIQAAVAAAAAGYTISVAAGTYDEIVTVDEDVTILGPNAGVEGDGTRNEEAVVTAFHMHAAGATLDGLTVLGGGMVAGNPAGIYVDADGVTLTNLVIEGDGTASTGVLTPYNGGVTGLVLSRSLISGWHHGTYFNPTTGFAATDNSFDGNGNAIVGDDWDDSSQIAGNSFTNSAGSHIGYGVLDTVDDVGAYFGAGNSFGGTNRPTSIFAYGDGTPAAQTVHGTELSNLVRGETAGENYLFHGRGGDDRLVGNDGNDTFDGGTGNDTIVGGSGIDTVILADSTFSISPVSDADSATPGDQPGWTITTAGEGTDTISGIEIIDSAAAGRILIVGQGGFATIQAAVDAASDGDTIFVASGTYAELVTVDKDVTIAGINSGIPAGDPRNPEAIVDGGFYIHSAGAKLDGLTILGGGTLGGNPAAIYIDADDVVLANLIVQGDDSVGTGILTTYDVTGLELRGSRVSGWDAGTYFNPGTQFTAIGNSFADNGNAIIGDDWSAGTLIDDNDFAGSVGAHIGYGAFDSVEDVGTYLGADNVFGPAPRVTGIYLYGDGTAGGQEVSGTDYSDYMAGAEYVAGSGDGAIFHGEGGNDYIDAGSGDDTLDGGFGNDTLDGGGDSDTAVYAGNSNDYSVTVVTDSNGAVIGYSSVVDNNAADGDEGSDTLIGIEHLEFANGPFVPNLAVRLYDESDNLVGSFLTIQAAIDQASFDYKIRVDAGTYDEDLVIDVGVTILGAGADNHVADRDAAGGSGETTILGHAVVTAIAPVTLDGLRFLNDPGTSAPTLQFLTGGGAAGHLVIDSIFWSTVAGGANGVDDRAISSVVIADGVITIAQNLISGTSQGQFGTASWGRGIWFDGGGVDLVVTDNVIEWSRTGLNLDMSGSSTANVSGNRLSGLGTGIAVGMDAEGLTVDDNDIERVGTEFSFRNLATGVAFNAGNAIRTLVPNPNDSVVVVLGGSGDDSFTGTGGADVLDGNNSPTSPGSADADILNGLGGNDQLFGRGGNDMLDGGTFDDVMTGGTGNDVYVVDTAGDSVVEAAGEGIDEVRTALAACTLAAALENLTGLGNVNQTLTGNSSDNRIDGGLGADSMTGGAGNDVYVVDNAGDTVTELAGEGTDEIRTSLATYSLAALANVENLTGTNAAGQTLTGNGSANVVSGAGGNDSIDGGAGADQMRGGGGDDLYFVDNAGDLVVENAGEGTDEVRTGLASHVLAANVENLTATTDINHDFRGNAGNNVIKGGAGNDLLRLQDGGDDTVLAGGGNDNIFMIGSLNSADIVTGGAGTDTLILQGNYAGGLTLSANVTQIELISILAGSNVNFGEPGTNRYDYALTTHDANFAAGLQARVNASALLEGEDFTFDGSAETDATFVVYGGKGKDTLIGGHGNDIFIYAEERFAPGDTVNGGPGGYDGIFFRGNYTIDFNAPGYFGLMTGIENMTLTSITDERYARGGGTEFDYNITLADNMLNAGIELTVSGALLQSYETMVVDGSLEMDGRLRFFAGRGNDTLKGGAQSDLILGSLGADTISGGGGADTFRYDTTGDSNLGTLDHILDFTPGTDKIDLTRVDANTLVAGNQAFTWIGSNAFSGSAGQLRAVQQGGEWMIEGDTNGDGVADLVIAVTLQGATPLSAGDFFP